MLAVLQSDLGIVVGAGFDLVKCEDEGKKIEKSAVKFKGDWARDEESPICRRREQQASERRQKKAAR